MRRCRRKGNHPLFSSLLFSSLPPSYSCPPHAPCNSKGPLVAQTLVSGRKTAMTSVQLRASLVVREVMRGGDLG